MTIEDPSRSAEKSPLITTATPFNLAAPPGHQHNYKLEPEEHASDRHWRLHREIVLFYVSLFLLLATLGICAYALIFATLSTDQARWVQSLVTLIAGGFIGYFLKK